MPSKRPPQEILPPFGAVPTRAPAPKEPSSRDRRLLIALWVSLPLVLLMLLAGVGLMWLQLWSWMSLRSFASGDMEAAAASYQRQVTVTQYGPAPWVAEYNLGTMQLQTGQVDEGIEHLKQAYGTVPKAIPAEDGTIQTFTYECQVRINLATGLETVADGQRSSGQLQAAVDTYDSALEWSKPCQGSSDSSQAQQGQSGGDGSDGQSSQDQQSQGQGGQDGENGQGGQDSQDQPNQGQQDNKSDAGSSTSERIEQKKQETQRELNGETGNSSDNAGGQGDQGQQDQGQGSSGGGGSSGQDQQDQNSDPFAGETDQQREQRESLQEKNRQQQEQQRERDESSYRDPGTKGW